MPLPAFKNFVLLALLVAAFLLATGGFITFSVGAFRLQRDFERMRQAVVMSQGIKDLMASYDACRWTAFVTGLVAILAFPVVLLAVAALGRRDAAIQGMNGKYGLLKRFRRMRALLHVLGFLCSIASITAVIVIAANVKAGDKIAETQTRIESGTGLLNGLSQTLSAIQKNSSSQPSSGLLTGFLDALTGTGSGSGDASSSLLSSLGGTDINGLFQLIAPMTVGTLIGMLDPSPAALLKLAAFLSSETSASTPGSLQCAPGCLNQIDACICNIGQIQILADLQSTAKTNALVSLIGSVLLALGLGSMLMVATHEAAKRTFQQNLSLGNAFDRFVAVKQSLLATDPNNNKLGDVEGTSLAV